MLSIVEVFYQPGKLFASLRDRKAAWIIPLLADMLILMASVAVMVSLVGLDVMMRQRLQNTNMSPEQMQLALSRMSSPNAAYFSYAGSVASTILIVLLITGLLMVFAMMTQEKPRFGSMLSMVTLALLPYWLITFVMTTLVLVASPDRTSLDFTNLLATNIGAFMDKTTTSKGFYSLMTSMDLLSFFGIGMLAYGFSKVTRAGISSGLAAILTLWILFIAGRAAVASLF
jgi:hypothetical protein